MPAVKVPVATEIEPAALVPLGPLTVSDPDESEHVELMVSPLARTPPEARHILATIRSQVVPVTLFNNQLYDPYVPLVLPVRLEEVNPVKTDEYVPAVKVEAGMSETSPA